MKIKIENEMYLESDGMQFVLKEYSGKSYENKKTGDFTEAYNTLGYFPSISSALKHIVKLKVMESTATDLKQLLESVEAIKQYIEERIAV